jgi:hypothetical protein
VPPHDPGNPIPKGEQRSNQTHASTTDPDALLARKSMAKRPSSAKGNLLAEKPHNLIVNAELSQANGTTERDAALVMLEKIPGRKRVTLGAKKGYDTRDSVAECGNLDVDAAHGTEHQAEQGHRHRHRTPAIPDTKSARRRGRESKSTAAG